MLLPVQTFIVDAPPPMTAVSEVCAQPSPCDAGHRVRPILYCPVPRLTPLYLGVLIHLRHALGEGIAPGMTSV